MKKFDGKSMKSPDGELSSSEIYYRQDQENILKEIEITRLKLVETAKQLAATARAKYLAQNQTSQIINAVREPLLVLDKNMVVVMANEIFYDSFKVGRKETIGQSLYDLGNRQWDIPKLKLLLHEVLPQKTHFVDFLVSHNFEQIGLKFMLISGKEFIDTAFKAKMIILAIRDISNENNRNELLLSASELRYRRLFEAAQDGLLLLDYETGMITDVNQFLISLLGYSRSVFLGKHVWEIGLFKDIVASKDNFKTLQAKKYIRYEDLPLQTKKGHNIEVEFVSNVYKVDGISVIQCNIRDITARKIAERTARESQDRFRTLMEQSPSSIAYLDSKGTLLTTNKSCLTMYGVKDGQGFSNYNLFDDPNVNIDDKKSLKKQKAVRFQSIYDFDLIKKLNLFKTSKKGKILVDVSITPLVDSKSVPNGYLVETQDVTERRKLEFDLRKSEENFRNMYLFMNDGVVNIDESGKLSDANPAALQLLGLTEKQITGKESTDARWLSFKEDGTNFPPDEQPGNVALRTGLKQQGVIGIESPAFTDRRWVKVTATPYYKTNALDENQKISERNVLVTFSDITDRKNLENALSEVNILKDNFLFVVSHEIKSPLLPIKSQSQLLLDGDYGKLNKLQKDAVSMIYRNENKLERITSQILDLTKIKSNRLNLYYDIFDLRGAIIEAVTELKEDARIKDLSMDNEVGPDLPRLEADKFRVEQVLNILIDNAIKFTPKGGSIIISAKKVNNDIIVTVKDTGIGIDAKDANKLFEPFFQIQGQVGRRFRGTGMGLAIAKGIMVSHGGKIWVESKGKNKGSSFYFSLPIKKRIISIKE